MSNVNTHEEDYPFFTAAPAKKSSLGWKIATVLLASCLSVSLYLNATGSRHEPPVIDNPVTETAPTQDPNLDNQLGELAEKNRELEEKIAELTDKNTQLTNRVVSLLNECNELNRELEQGKNNGLTNAEIEQMQENLEKYELLVNSYIAMLRKDTSTLNANVEKLMEQANNLPAEARNALYILLEYMDRN